MRNSDIGHILDVGCGTGGTVAFLAQRYKCTGIDCSEYAIAAAKRKYPQCTFIQGTIPQGLTDRADGAVLILLMDVLEHIEDDRAFLSQLLTMAAPGEYILITVPADPRLWSRHDETAGHLRRYTDASLQELFSGLSIRVCMLGGFNRRLYPLIRIIRWATKLTGRAFGRGNTDFAIPPKIINRLLTRIFSGEAASLVRLLDKPPSLWTGQSVSLIALLQKEMA
ncbi:MAG: class I SAM-dependent methyltransferase [Rhodospirillales bacterium]|nr:class I SAM-dependent methyltransferase [Rhodospirillales bacterium]